MRRRQKRKNGKILCLIVFIGILIIGVIKFKFSDNNILLSNDNVKEQGTDEHNNENVDKGQAVSENKSAKAVIKEEECITKKPEDVDIPILMYHSISSENPKNNLLVPQDQFDGEVKWLKENGFTPMLMDDVYEALETGKVPKRPVAITFDDGYKNNYTDAYQSLKKYNMTGTFFVVTNYTDNNPDYMSLDMLKEMHENGMGIESHTATHMELDKLSKADKISSIKGAQDFLKEKLGIENKFLCYPVGKSDEETVEVAKSLGIKAAVTTKFGLANKKEGELTLKRIRIAPMNLENFKAIFADYMK